jgi:serine/threonine-protein kinase
VRGGQAADDAGARKGDFLCGKYLLEDCLGIGGMGEVYRATNVSLGRKVAIKILNKEHTSNEEDVMRFLREARAAAAVRHVNVVDVFDVSRDDDGTPVLGKELLSGQDLEQYLGTRPDCLSAAEALEIMIPVADAVAAAHKQDVVHRDLKPANIFLAREGTNLIPKVLDFGACLYQTVGALSAKEQRMLIGTPHYMAPEQISTAADVDARADVWAMGVILYEMLAGETPFEAEDGAAVMKLVRTRNVLPLRKIAPLAPVSLEAFVTRCLERDRKKRFADASTVRIELDKIRTELKKSTRKSVDARSESDDDLDAPPKVAPLRRRPSTVRRGSSMLTLSSPDDEVDWGTEAPLHSSSRPIEAAKPAKPAVSAKPALPAAAKPAKPAVSAKPALPAAAKPARPGRTAADIIRDAELAAKPTRTAADVIRDAELAAKPTRTAADVIRDAELAAKPTRTAADVIRDAELAASASGASSASPSTPPLSGASSRRSSIPPVLDPRAAGSADRSVRSDRPPPSARTAALGSADAVPPSQPGARELALSGPVSVPRPRPSSTAESASPAPFTGKDNALMAAALVVPALVAYGVFTLLPSVTAPLGHAMRGDSPLASGVLAVLTLVGAATLAAKSLGSSDRSAGMVVATIGALLLGIVMIIVTFSASETAEIEVPPAAGTIVPFLAPFIPLGLALAAIKRARGVLRSRFPDERAEGKRFAVLASLMLFALLELAPFGAVRAAARTQAPAPAPASTVRPAP